MRKPFGAFTLNDIIGEAPAQLLLPFAVSSIKTVFPMPWPCSVIPAFTVSVEVQATPPEHAGMITVSPFVA